VSAQPPGFWKVGPCDIRLQVHIPEHAEKLSRVTGVHLVAWSHCGNYIRIFAADKSPRWAKDYVARLGRTNERFSKPASPLRGDADVVDTKTLVLVMSALNQMLGSEIEAQREAA
jgi:hypothetical protein